MALVQPRNDIAALWEEALDDYKKITDIDMRCYPTGQRSVNSIMVSQASAMSRIAVFGFGLKISFA